jgi:hypothetical protein
LLISELETDASASHGKTDLWMGTSYRKKHRIGLNGYVELSALERLSEAASAKRLSEKISQGESLVFPLLAVVNNRAPTLQG